MCHSHHFEDVRHVQRSTSSTSSYREFVHHAMKLGSAVLICVAIWALSGAGYFWPAWVIVIGGFKLGMEARARFSGSASDRERELEDTFA